MGPREGLQTQDSPNPGLEILGGTSTLWSPSVHILGEEAEPRFRPPGRDVHFPHQPSSSRRPAPAQAPTQQRSETAAWPPTAFGCGTRNPDGRRTITGRPVVAGGAGPHARYF